jgi:low temperature requirement protein LtrA
VAHLTERHGLFIILAIGESVVAIGVGAASQPISTPLLVAAILGMAAAVALWWLYFDVVPRPVDLAAAVGTHAIISPCPSAPSSNAVPRGSGR